jgi:hypothetical protein
MDATITIYQSNNGGATWTIYTNDAWERSKLWGLATIFAGLWLRATETGNGIDYVGESLPSNELHL